jgi:hypothetical protein
MPVTNPYGDNHCISLRLSVKRKRMGKTTRGLNSKMKLLHPVKEFFLRPFQITEPGLTGEA